MRNFYKSVHDNGNECYYYFDPNNDFDEYGEIKDWTPWWIYHTKTDTFDYCTMLEMMDYSDICEKVVLDEKFEKRLWDIHNRFYKQGMVRNIKT